MRADVIWVMYSKHFQNVQTMRLILGNDEN